MPAKSIGKTLKELRLKCGLSQKQAYEYIGVAQSTFSSWEVGKAEPPNEVFLQLCDLYNVDDILSTFGYDGYNEDGSIQLNMKEISTIEKYRFISEHSPDGAKNIDTILDREYSIAEQMKKQNEHIEKLDNSNTRFINYYYRLASAGTGQILFDAPPTKRIEIPDTPENKKAAYAIGVNGNSMEPVYHDGDTLLIEMTEEIQPGDTGIFLVNGESYIKKLGDQELISLNPKYKNIPLDEDTYCLGKVLAALK